MTVDHNQEYYESLAAMLDSLPERLVRYRISDLTIVYCNASWAAWYDLVPDQIVGSKLDTYLSEDGKAGLKAQLGRLGPDNPLVTDSVVREAPRGGGRWIEWVDRYLAGTDGPEVLAVGRDITARYHAETKVAENEELFRDLADKSTDVLWRFAVKPYPHFEYMSPSVEKILGYPPSFFLEDFDRVLEIVSDEDQALIDRAFKGEPLPPVCDFHYRRADGTVVICELRLRYIRGGLQGVGRDVTELRMLQASLSALALRDPLTGLANRRLFRELLDADLARTRRSGQPLAVVFLDLDDFKAVNDSYGHDAGDTVLCEIARRLTAVVRGADVVARLGGDEFVIVFEANDPSSENLVARLDYAIGQPIELIDGTTMRCHGSIGVADTRNVGYEAGALLAASDAAMYAIKRSRQRSRSAPYDRVPALVL